MTGVVANTPAGDGPEPEANSASKPSSKQLRRVAVLVIAVCGLLVKLPVLQTVQVYWEDSYWFSMLARSLESGQYSTGSQPHSRFFPGYPLSLAGVDLALGKTKDVAYLGAWLTAIACSLAAGLCLPLYRRWGLGDLGSGLAIIALLLCPALNLFGALPLYEGYFALFVVVSLLLEARGQTAMAALVAGFAALVKPEGAFLVLGVALAAPTWRGRMLGLVLGGLPLAPWFLRNLLVLGGLFQTEYASIYKGFAESGAEMSGPAYLRHYPTFFNPLVILVALPGLLHLRKFGAAALYGVGTLLLHILWPGDLERYVLPHFPLIYFAFGSTLDRLGKRSPSMATVLTLIPLLGFLVWHYPDRILGEVTRSASYGTAAKKVSEDPDRSVTALGADHAALSEIGKHFAYSAWHQLDKPGLLMVADLVRNHKLRYHLVTNYFNIDRRFDMLKEGQNLDIPLPDGNILRYQLVLLSFSGYLDAQPRFWGFDLEVEAKPYQVLLFEVSVFQPQPKAVSS